MTEIVEDIENQKEIEILLENILKELKFQSEMIKEAFGSKLNRKEIDG